MTRWAGTMARLDQAHAILRDHPGVTADEFTAWLPTVPCGTCAMQCHMKPEYRVAPADCRRCRGTDHAPPDRSVAYTLLTKLEQDGRARRVKPHCAPHLWSAVEDADAAELDAWWQHLHDNAPGQEPVAEWLELAGQRAELQAQVDDLCARMDALVYGMVDALDREQGDTMKGLAARLGVHYSKLNGARWRHLDRQDRGVTW